MLRRPQFPYQSGNGRLTQAEPIANGLLSFACSKQKDLCADVLWGVSLRPGDDGVSEILFVGEPLQVGMPIVGLHAVGVIDLRETVGVCDKRASDKAVDADKLSYAGPGDKPDPEIPPVGEALLQYLSGEGLFSTIPAHYDAGEAPHVAVTADLVELGEVHEGYCSPFFIHQCARFMGNEAIYSAEYVSAQGV